MNIKKISAYTINSIWAIPLVLLIRVIRPLLLIKFIKLDHGRIGHFVADSFQLINLSKQGKLKFYPLIWFEEPAANEYWSTFVKRNLSIKQWTKLLYHWNIKIPGGKVHLFSHFLDEVGSARDWQGNLENSTFRLSFTEKENKEGKKWLSSRGWKEGRPFVCVIVRDAAYLETSELTEGFDWSYHDYRNSKIQDYLPALEWLTEQDVLVLRMGKTMEKPLLHDNKMIIDYAFLDEKSDFLDVWLFANCDLCITTGTGVDMISDVFRKPLLFLNCLPLSYIFSWSYCFHYPKNLYWKKTGKILTLKELINNTKPESYEENIIVKDLNSDEILISVKEAWGYFRGSLKLKKEDTILQDKFWKIIKSENR